MLLLAFESSAKAGSVALLRDGILLAEYYQNGGQTHSRTLMKMAEDMLGNCDLTPKDVDAVGVASGPGSFTGVRIGVSAAKGFAWAGELPCVGVSTLEAMACGVLPFHGIVCAVMDARRSQVYNALFRSDGCTLTRLCPDRAVSIDELAADLEKTTDIKILVGDGAQLCYNTLQGRIDGLCIAPEHLRHQRASGVALCAEAQLLGGDPGDGGALVPNYLRLSQAERERLERENKNRNKGE
jgi:tRNA threonylcarbamoyladenosine biosynthesis protein TsaB